MLHVWAQRIVLLSGRQRLIAAFCAGLAAALAMPPVNLIITLGVSLPVAVWLLDGATAGPGRFSSATLRSAFGAGWAFGFGFFLGGFWWLGAAFLVEDDQFAWALPFGVIGLPAALALFHGLGFLLARILWSDGWRRIFAFTAAMTGVEWLRGIILTGFPWNSLGQALGATDATAQIASLVGLNGMTVLAVFIFSAPGLLATGRSRADRYALPALALIIAASLTGFGLWRLASTRLSPLPDVRIRIMQPNLSQREKHRMSGQEVLSRYIALSDRATTPGTSGAADITHLLWPESPFPFLLAREPQALAQIAALLKPNTMLITGAARAEDAGGDAWRFRYFNAIHVVGPDGAILDSYDKVHLVPFGEYLPFKELFDLVGLRQFVAIPGGFEPGVRRKPLEIRGLPLALPLICYEAIFPGEIGAGSLSAGLLINVTNDGWFGHTFGPYQHLAQARLRSIEQGLPQIRAANTGISAVIDPLGRITRSLPLGQAGVIDSIIAQPLSDTWFRRFGDYPALFLLLLCFFVCVPARFR